MNKFSCLLMALFFLSFTLPVSGQVVVNELLSSNNNANTDEDGSHEDWVEIYNGGESAVNLDGFGLSDDGTNPLKWKFPNITIQPNAYMLIWCSDKNRITPGNPLHTNWKISASGESIYLSNANGTVIDFSPSVSISADLSYGRLPNGTGGFVFFSDITPGTANGPSGYEDILPEPVFSQNSGFSTTGFDLTLSTDIPGATIIYTLDGSEPSESNLTGTTYNYKNQYPMNPGQEFGPMLFNTFTTKPYDAPIAVADRTSEPNKIAAISSTFDFEPPYFPSMDIFKATVVRAKVVKPGSLPGKTATRNYFISPLGENRFTLPVVSISIDEDKLFDYEDGIYVAGKTFDDYRTAFPTEPVIMPMGNYSWKGSLYERKSNFSYFVGGQQKINQDIGIRIQGNYSRIYPRKSLNFYSRADYGAEVMPFQFFQDEPYNNFENIVLKNLGSDFYMSLFKDAMCNELARPLNTQTEASQPAIAFINGEYWGLMTLREKYDDKFFSRVYGILGGELDLLENDGSINNLEEGDNIDYLDFFDYVANNSFAGEENFSYIKTRMDTENFTDYFITNIFFANEDWPASNIIFWRKKTTYNPNAPYGSDGRWRWAIHDMDFAGNDYNLNTLSVATDQTGTLANPAWSTLILRKLLENPTFKNDFISRFADVLNSAFMPSRSTAQIAVMKAQLLPEMPEHIARWKAPADMGQWNYFTDVLETFVTQRPDVQRSHIRGKFGIANNIEVTVAVSNTNAGHVRINTVDIADTTPGIAENPYPWTGIYFSGIPVKLKAIPKPGFTFSHWTGASTATTDEITIMSDLAFEVTAVFNHAPNEVSVPINFWFMDGAVPNDQPLSNLSSSYEAASNGVIGFQSAFEGYPYDSSHPNWRKASMERRNKPTPVNYRPDANGGQPYVADTMKGLQITQPFQDNGRENTMIFNLSTKDYKNIRFSFAAMDEGAATGIAIDYSVTEGESVWITDGMPITSFPLSPNIYQLYEADFTAIESVNDNPDFKIRLRFTGPNMTASDGNRVTFNNIAVDGVKLLQLSYQTPNVFTVGLEIQPLIPTVSSNAGFSISPDLPPGLALDAISGIISGTPTAVTSTSAYTVTAENGSSVSFELFITVNDSAPSDLSYPSPNIFTIGSEITALNPAVTGNITNYSIVPALPDGLSIDSATGVISGTSTMVFAADSYTVTAVNSGGSVSCNLVITVNDIPPSALWYIPSNVFALGWTIENLIPTVVGNNISYTVSPALPDGLFLDPVTGVIWGTPTILMGISTYTITAINSGGSVSFDIIIMVLPPLGVGDSRQLHFEVCPNPFDDYLSISGVDGAIDFRLFSMDGRLIEAGITLDSEIRFSNLPKGMYLLELSSDGRKQVKKLVKN